MGSKKSYLVISNQTNSNIVMKTDVRTSKDWDGNSRPDKNFDNVNLTAYDSLQHREELNSHTDHDGEFTMTIFFEDGKFIQFKNKQEDAFTKKNKSDYQLEAASTNDFILNHSSGSGTNSFTIVPREDFNNWTWMEELLNHRPDIRLRDVVIPASHDAGMYVTTDCDAARPEWSITQTLSIKAQLKAGSRYFDLRVADNGKVYHTTAGAGCYGHYYTDILEEVNEFTDFNGRNEVIILKLSHCKKGIRHSVVKDTKRLLNTKLYTTDDRTIIQNKQLKGMQGKIVCVFDRDEFKDYIDAEQGIISYRSLSEKQVKDDTLYAGLSVYDEYSETTDFEYMKSDQLKKLSKYGGLGENHLFLLSWTITGSLKGELDIQSLATRCKPNLPDTLKNMRQGEINKPNLVYTDFVDKYLSKIIIDLNWV